MIKVPSMQPTIRQAIAAAHDGDTVLVADGTYSGPLNTEIGFDGKAITVKSEHGPALCVIDCKKAARGFYFRRGETRKSILAGFTVRNGRAFCGGAAPYQEHGGGILCVKSSPTIKNCVVELCRACDTGGGIACLAGSAPLVALCTVRKNAAEAGGGIACGEGSDATIEKCAVESNIALNPDSGDGGGILASDSSPAVRGCAVSYNTAANGGGFACRYDSVPTLQDCRIFRNTALDNFMSGCGGGVAIFSAGGHPKISSCDIYRNDAEWDGGGVYCSYDTAPLIYQSAIVANHALFGGGIVCDNGSMPVIAWSRIAGNEAMDFGGGIDCEFESRPLIERCTIERNRAMGADPLDPPVADYFLWEAGTGGGICARNSGARVRDSVIRENEAAAGGGGLYCFYKDAFVPAVRNCTLTGNSAGLLGSAVYCRKTSFDIPDTLLIANSVIWGNGETDIQGGWCAFVFGAADEDPLLVIEGCDIEEGLDGVGLAGSATVDGTGNIDEDPLLAADGVHLGADSPCRDAGKSAFVEAGQSDFDGQARVMGAAVDIGADETAP